MHFRCVLYMLNYLYAVRLDWAKPMMYLNLHITCSCIFMHTYLHSFIFLYTVVVGTFLIVSFPLSLSLFLALVYSMSPKCKSTPPQNPLHSEASSSSNPTLSSVRFHDDEAQKDFSENFCREGIHSERHVILLDFSNIDLSTVIYSRGWESFYDIPITYPSVIILEFYSNMHGIDTLVPYFFSRVRGTCIVVTLEIVFEVLHIPRVAHPNYPG